LSASNPAALTDAETEGRGMAKPQLLVDGLAFPEGPRWQGERLWFSDFAHRTLYRIGLDGTQEVVAELDDTPSGLGFLPDGTAVVVSMQNRQLLRIADGRGELYADLAEFAGDFLNDMVIDGDGNAYVGTRTREMRPSRSPLPARYEVDSIVLVDPGGHARVAADHLISPNGTVVAADGSYLVIAETYAHRLTRFDRAPDGSLSGRRVFAEVRGSFPDGICLDEEGAVWFGSPYTNEFVRVRDGGEVTDRLPLPGGVACMLGGDRRQTLFLLGVDPGGLPVPDSTSPLPQHPSEAPPTGGHIWTMPVSHPGVGWP
jgi:sugar lactone lactonase YvrE